MRACRSSRYVDHCVMAFELACPVSACSADTIGRIIHHLELITAPNRSRAGLMSSLPWLCQKEELRQEIEIVPRSASNIR
jgi:hypothetical protein